ncbi:MAG: protein-L-isoaspartate(D-aspartate) O-methyltransferase [Prevotellaceae bacterium]|jgi:protein-L-isoaspartate(D-aspartate) O-methyltransferase|nr:protein-L-isoaspartate(D-aspartate) O-methyltransferase [Prevotellaceae bacterium]
MDKFDSFRHQGLRQKLVKLLREKGIADERVLSAIAKIPRHFFLDSALDRHAYDDKAIPIAAGQTISQPYTVAMQTQLLQVVPGEKVLEIGTGSGYQAAVLCEMGASLFSIERQQELHAFAKKMLGKMGYKPHLIFGDGFAGIPEEAPFSKIIVTCGAASLPQALLEQLAVGGRMVIPVGGESVQQMYVVERLNEHDFKQIKYGMCSFVPMLQGVQNNS